MPINSLESVSDTLLRKSNHTDIGNHSIEDSKLALKSLVIGHAAVSSVEEKLERRENNPGANSSSSLLHALCNQAQV
jgi:selenophosphate synthase